jgi:deoxyribodipyrimidine photo-lyase
MATIVWFRQDLRIRDNPALAAAAALGPILPVYILDEITPGPHWRHGGASRWWLHCSLTALADELGALTLRRGDPRTILPALIEETGATAVYWNRCYEPFAVDRDSQLKASLQAKGIEVASFNSSLLHEPWELTTGSGGAFKVYTPFWRASRARSVTYPFPVGQPPKANIVSWAGDLLAKWNLLPTKPDWATGWQHLWQPGETGALAKLDKFVSSGLAGYRTRRDRPDLDGSSRLSPHLHFGEISPRQIWARLAVEAEDSSKRADVEKFCEELGWREFAYHLLYHFPSLPEDNWRRSFDRFPWRKNDRDFAAWQTGHTGYPFVDAAMRELWQTGWMHNRARMVAASFLVKHLRIDWRRGEAWFWDTLVDADLANNAAGWQWVAGSGADAAPYFRIFNPIVQGRKFDASGNYVRRWCPELARLSDDHIHAPFEAPPDVLAQCGVRLGENYPHPIVDHTAARRAALAGYEQVKAAPRLE